MVGEPAPVGLGDAGSSVSSVCIFIPLERARVNVEKIAHPKRARCVDGCISHSRVRCGQATAFGHFGEFRQRPHTFLGLFALGKQKRLKLET